MPNIMAKMINFLIEFVSDYDAFSQSVLNLVSKVNLFRIFYLPVVYFNLFVYTGDN